MKIALVQLNTTIGDFAKNTEGVRSYAEKAKEAGCDLVVFPEMVITGYPPRDLLEKKDFVQANLKHLHRLVDSVRGIGVVLGYVDENPRAQGNPLYNSCALFENGMILHKVHKQLLPTYDVFDETRYFEPGQAGTTILFKGYRIGLTVCEDIWNDKDFFARRFYAGNPVEALAHSGADFLINVSASPYHLGKRDFKWKMLSAVAEKYSLPLFYANQVGGNDSVLFDGLSMAFDHDGRMIARACDFAEDMVCADIETNTGDFHEITKSDMESLFAALKTGVRDYVHKCGFSKVVIGLSGGIDSALTAVIARDALGAENVSTVFMPSMYTSQENFIDTEKLAGNLGVSYGIIPIDDIYRDFEKLISSETNLKNPGITEQNIQARIRGTLLMAISNRDGCLVLSTGNKSEMAIGYCTLYGDMNGGLSVISDVPKTIVWELSRFINKEKERIPVRIIEKAPSAELKPDQKDEDDIPPYHVLDRILKSYIEELKSEDEIIAEGHEPKMVRDIIKRIVVSEYKRHQAAPGLKVTSRAFGYGRRYPLAQRYIPDNT